MFFGSDNQTGASLQVLEMVNAANKGYAHGYGDDQWTRKAIDSLKEIFECDLEVYFVSTGTASNSLALSCLVKPWESVLCHSHAHIILDESTTPELFTGGARLVPISKGEGKITADNLIEYFKKAGTNFPHNSQARALSITQTSECGLVYTPDEIKELSFVVKQDGIGNGKTNEKESGLKIHMDGARFANALASIGCTPAELSWRSGVDVLSLGATKCGALFAEAVIFFDKKLAEPFIYHRKRTGHLISKTRFIGAQFAGWLQDNHWLALAGNANTQAAQLAKDILSFKELKLTWPVQANELFVIMPANLANSLHEAGAEFYYWYIDALPSNIKLGNGEVIIRLVTSFATEDKHREDFCELIRQYFKSH
ncbi:MAG: low specificity L-threonine aldolase [Desulfamplus sp.]|nr:low specificity L-threonine aldolase [Desulfamplus sp.]